MASGSSNCTRASDRSLVLPWACIEVTFRLDTSAISLKFLSKRHRSLKHGAIPELVASKSSSNFKSLQLSLHYSLIRFRQKQITPVVVIDIIQVSEQFLVRNGVMSHFFLSCFAKLTAKFSHNSAQASKLRHQQPQDIEGAAKEVEAQDDDCGEEYVQVEFLGVP